MRVTVGMGSCGIGAGALRAWDALEASFSRLGLDQKVERVGCNGMCFDEPIVEVISDSGHFYYGNVDEKIAERIASEHVKDGNPVEEYLISASDMDFLRRQTRVALCNCGSIDPEKIDEYIGSDGYAALRKCLTEMTPEQVIGEIKASGLRGRGGAGFPTWRKWDAARSSPGKTKYIICNADEGDPGAFMDRSLLEGDPNAVIEGMAIAGYAIGSGHGIFYVRAEYPLAIKRLETAIEQARLRGFIGSNILGTGFDFDLSIKAGAGAFVCGEETALIASLEGERGMPRLKPPFPAEKGYWQEPTNINNVETYGNISWIIRNGGAAFAAMGTEASKGTKVFALAGKVKKSGLVEVPMGMTIRQIIYDIGGGIKGDRDIKGVQMGGPSGGCIPKHLLDTPVDYESISKAGAIMGSGGMIVMDEDTCMVDMARFFLDFTQKESCGKCVHCRIGTKRMLEILNRIVAGEGREGDMELLEDLGRGIIAGSLCGLGQSAPNPALSTLKQFPEEYRAHIYDKKCPAHKCRPLLTYMIDENKCVGCLACVKKCPVNAITGEVRKPQHIDPEICVRCGSCEAACRFDAVLVD